MTYINLIIGGKGFIGSFIMNELKRKRQNVFVIDRLDDSNFEDVSKKLISKIELKKIKILKLYQFGAITEWKKIHQDPINFEKDSIRLMNNFIKLKSRIPIPFSTIYPSSGKVYLKSNNPLSENYKTNPTTLLGSVKLKIENLLIENRLDFEKLLICRIFNVYGPNQKNSFLVPTIIRQLKDSNKQNIELGNLYDKRDYLYVTDVASAVLTAADKIDLLNEIEIVNVGSGNGTDALTITNILKDYFNSKKKVITVSEKIRVDENPVEIANNKKLRELGWLNKISLKKGLKNLL